MFAQVASFLFVSLTLCSAAVVNLNVTRKVDLSTPIVKIRSEIIMQNQESSKVTMYFYKIDRNVSDFHVEFYGEGRKKLFYSKHYDKSERVHTLKITLEKPLMFMESCRIYVEAFYMNNLQFVPKAKKFREPQYVKYVANTFFFSPYQTVYTQTLYIKTGNPPAKLTLPHPDVEFFIYDNVPPLATNETLIEFENDNMLLKATNLDRMIDISHYGRITITDTITLKDIGSGILGSFEPDVYEMQKSNKYWIKTHLPHSVEDIKLYDAIGYLYKYQVMTFDNHQLLKFQHRYPLLGNWQATYTLRYTVPVYEYLKWDKSGLFHLEIRAIDHISNDIVIEAATVKILLPEGAVFKTIVNIPMGLTKEKDEVVMTSLTYLGRPTIVLRGKNLVEHHIIPVSVFYNLSDIFMFRVPLLTFLYIYIIFLFVIAYQRCNFGLK